MLKMIGPSLTLGRVAGIPIKVHWSFSIVIILALYIINREGLALEAAMWFFGFIASLFLFVIMHEFGHALMARKYGVHTRDVILSPIGGVARLEQIPANPWHELWIALAGPAVNVVLFILFFVLLYFTGQTIIPDPETLFNMSSFWDLAGFLLTINILLVVFNMIPAFPMDGGRVLRATLSMILKNRLRATQIASYIGQALALAFIGFGIHLESYSWVLIGMFVTFTARSEYRQLRVLDMLKTTQVRDIMRKNFTTFRDDESLNNPYQQRNEGSFLIKDLYGNIVGVLPHLFLKRVKQEELDQPIRSRMMTEWGPIYDQMSLQSAFSALNDRGWALAPVFDANNDIVGVIDRTLIRQVLKKG